jgi:hypothetical protein
VREVEGKITAYLYRERERERQREIMSKKGGEENSCIFTQ